MRTRCGCVCLGFVRHLGTAQLAAVDGAGGRFPPGMVGSTGPNVSPGSTYDMPVAARIMSGAVPAQEQGITQGMAHANDAPGAAAPSGAPAATARLWYYPAATCPWQSSDRV